MARLCFILVCTLFLGARARAEAPVAAVSYAGPSVYAEQSLSDVPAPFGSVSEFFAGLGSRARIIQVSIVIMCLALFILLKKFAEPMGGADRGPSDRRLPN
jgi:hypothetical protein